MGTARPAHQGPFSLSCGPQEPKCPSSLVPLPQAACCLPRTCLPWGWTLDTPLLLLEARPLLETPLVVSAIPWVSLCPLRPCVPLGCRWLDWVWGVQGRAWGECAYVGVTRVCVHVCGLCSGCAFEGWDCMRVQNV